MAVNKKTIQRRIKSVRNTRKITKAMELVAAAKMRRATGAVVRTRPYAHSAWETVRAIMRHVDDVHHPLMTAPNNARKILLVVYASDRGLAGGYNVNILRKAMAMVRERGSTHVDIIAIGRRAESMAKSGANMVAAFHGLTNHPQLADMLPIVRMILERFASGVYREVHLGSTEFISGISQVPKILQLLPLLPPESQPTGDEANQQYSFEPNPMQVLDRILPGIIETTMFHALLEAAASEHAARMMAMRNATDSATEMLDDLTFTYNQARQAAITQEIAELVSGSAALQK